MFYYLNHDLKIQFNSRQKKTNSAKSKNVFRKISPISEVKMMLVKIIP